MSVANRIPLQASWPEEEADLVGFPDLLSVLAKRKVTVLVIAVLVTAASVAAALRQETTYASQGSVLVATTAQPAAAGAQALATEARLARSRSVAIRVIDDLQLDETPEDLLDGLSVTVPVGTQIMEFKYTASTKGRAQRTAQAFVESYLNYRRDLLDRMLVETRGLSEEAASLRRNLAQAEARAVASQDPTVVANANEEARSLTDQIAGLDQKLTALLGSDNLITSTSAQDAAPAVAQEPSLVRAGIVGLVAGIFLGAIAAFLLELLSRRPRAEHAVNDQRTRKDPHNDLAHDERGASAATGWRPTVPHSS